MPLPSGGGTPTRKTTSMLTDFPHRVANLSDPAPDYPWPEGYRSAVFPAFDVDAETAWLNYDAKNTDRLLTRPSVALPRC